MKITDKQVEILKRRLLFTFGALRVVKDVKDESIRRDRIDEIREALSDMDDVVSEIEATR